ncbi:MAG TPA: hypothetical protein VGV38_15820 [Pyrinomonadaceae bacterium]|nr:hypothetical protein [Pyrinomonadaceae bacterium]
MNTGTRRTAAHAWPAIFLLLAAAAVAYAWRPALDAGGAASPPAQDLTRIESRLSQMEQRFYSIEASIRSLEQQSRLSELTAGRGARDPEVALLRADVDAMRRRLAEVECALARVDERTLTAAARKARGEPGDPCRLNADAPLRLPGRP